jgi:predicted nucleic acid-binding protein
VPVVDASVVVDWVAPDADPGSASLAARDRLAAAQAPLAAPRLLREEVLNALLTGVRRGRWSGAAADGAAVALNRLPIPVRDTDRDRERAFELARRYDNWPLYDMLHLALAERLGRPLVTADDRLRQRLSHLGWVLGPGDV